MGANYIRAVAAVNAFTGLAWFVQTCKNTRKQTFISSYPAVVKQVRDLRRVGLLLLLLVAMPGRGETAGFGEVREAIALWDRVFGSVPALEQFIRERRRPRGETFEALEAAVEAVSQQEASNPFAPLARGALLALTKKGSLQAAAAKASQRAGDRVAVRWLLYRAFLRLGEKEAADHELRQMREIRDRLGLDRISYLGWHQAHTATVLAARRDVQGAEAALSLAAEFDPVAPEVLFAQARIRLGRGSPQGLFPLVKGWWTSLTSPFYGPSHWVNILASCLLAIPLGLLLVGLLLILRVTPLFRHDLAEWRRRRLSPATQGFLPIALYLLPLILGLGLLPAVLLSLLPLGVYLKTRERLLWVGLILSLLLLPRGYRFLATLMTTTASPRYVTLLQVEEGDRGRDTQAALRRWAKEAPHDLLPRFYLGRVHRSRGELRQGIERYSQVPADALPELEAAIWTNRGNLAFLQGDLAQAKTAYEKALAVSPDLSYARFNLSQLLTERLLLEEAQQEYARAIHETPILEYRMRQAAAEGRKRVLVDAPLPATELWRQILLLDAPSPEMAETLWAGRFLGVSLGSLRWMVGGYLLVFGAIFWLRKRRRFARACQDCGKVFCPRCQRLLGEVRLCSRCAILERAQMGEVSPTIKNIPVEEVHREPRWLGLVLALVPGIEGLYRGRTLRGFLLLSATLFVVSPFLGTLLAPAIYLPGASLPYTVPASILLLLSLYLVATLTSTGSRRVRLKERQWR